MQVKTINEFLSVSDQIVADDVAALERAGFRSIICNRPDGEGADQPSFADLEAVAKSHGLVMRYQPIVPGKVTDADGADFGRLIDELPKPVLAFCRTGARASTLWSLNAASR